MIISYLLIIVGCVWILKVEGSVHSWNTGLADVLKGVLPSILMIAGPVLLWNALGLDPDKKQTLTVFHFFSMSIIAITLVWLAAHWILVSAFFLNTQHRKNKE